MNHRNIIRYVLSFKKFVTNCVIDINDIKNLPNVFLRRISEIIIMTNLKLHTFLKHAGCPRGGGGGGNQIRTMTDKAGRGVKNLRFCCTSVVNGSLEIMRPLIYCLAPVLTFKVSCQTALFLQTIRRHRCMRFRPSFGKGGKVDVS